MTATATLNFFKEGGIDTLQQGLVNNPQLEHEPHEVSIQDVRDREDEFKLDTHGFQFVSGMPTNHTDFRDKEKTEAQYYPEVEGYMLEITGGIQAHCISHNVRSPEDATTASKTRAYADYVHTDWEYTSSQRRLEQAPGRAHPSNYFDELQGRRWAAYSFWRPLNKVTRDAMCMADKRTVPDADLQAFKFFYSNGFEAKLNGLKYSDQHQWWYRSHMEPGDILVIKLHDSETDGRARCTPHTAFQTQADYGAIRESVETRLVVFF